MVRLSADRNDTRLHARFDAWLHSDPAHAQAWCRLQERLGSSFGTLRALEKRLPGQAGEARRVLMQPGTTRRDVLRAIGGLGLLGGGLWLAARSDTGTALMADLHTASGER
ncbi:DUF4880 domain-containing protein, partial [Pseudomonas brassicae]|uniref:DUF4880 domain-containing protein n=1 Tax=Pseudomonas brassicae TaxID=2708063 RepID=UPI003083ED32